MLTKFKVKFIIFNLFTLLSFKSFAGYFDTQSDLEKLKIEGSYTGQLYSFDKWIYLKKVSLTDAEVPCHIDIKIEAADDYHNAPGFSGFRVQILDTYYQGINLANSASVMFIEPMSQTKDIGDKFFSTPYLTEVYKPTNDSGGILFEMNDSNPSQPLQKVMFNHHAYSYLQGGSGPDISAMICGDLKRD